MKSMKCPITGVNLPRFLAAVVAGFIFVFISDYIVHGNLLMETYQNTDHLWRMEEDMQSFMPFMMGMQFLLALLVIFIFTRHYEEKGPAEGLRYGVMIGLLMGLLPASSYAWMPIPGALALAWFADGLLKGVGLGLIAALIYRKCKDDK